jgi:hypothetical protein
VSKLTLAVSQSVCGVLVGGVQSVPSPDELVHGAALVWIQNFSTMPSAVAGGLAGGRFPVCHGCSLDERQAGEKIEELHVAGFYEDVSKNCYSRECLD